MIHKTISYTLLKRTSGTLATLLTALFFISSAPAFGFSTEMYAPESRLSSGLWVKVGVTESGVYCIPTATLRKWGFSEPSRVRVYGWGGRRQDDVLSADNFYDNLPETMSELTDAGLVFYAHGPQSNATANVQGLNVRYYTSSDYTTQGYYFIGESDLDRLSRTTGAPKKAANPATTFTEVVHHEVDRYSPGEDGPLLVGEEFRYTPSRSFEFTLPDRDGSDPRVSMAAAMAINTSSGSSRMNFEVNGEALPFVSSDIVSTSTSTYACGTYNLTAHSFSNTSDKLKITLTYKPTGVLYNAWLDFMTLNYTRKLKMPSAGSLTFYTAATELRLESADAQNVRLWDITDPANVSKVNTVADGSGVYWSSDYTTDREYVAWLPGSKLPAPASAEMVPAQNLHAMESPEMVIITPGQWRQQAERLATFHRNRDMQVSVIDPEEIYNEFGSGAADVSAIRRFFKMLYDRGNAGMGTPLKYAILMGKMTYDNRHLTAELAGMDLPTLPSWVTRKASASMSESDGYCTDDFIAILGDNSGSDLGLDDLCIAVGRIPCTSINTAKVAVDKIEAYSRFSPGLWSNRIVFLCDDQDDAVHALQGEKVIENINTYSDNAYVVEKVYLDAYERIGGKYPQARTDMFNALDEGTLWWMFIGHAASHAWTGEGQLTFSDINSLYLRRPPFLYAATCNFLRWDCLTNSGGEILFSEPNGGVSGMISATRPVYITDNGYFSYAMGKMIGSRDENGNYYTFGEVYRRAKNNILGTSGKHQSNYNRLRYVFMGDPAMSPVLPSYRVLLESINGESVTDDDLQVTIPARGRAVFTGRIIGPDGSECPDLNGTLSMEIYDATTSHTTRGYDDTKKITFDTHGKRLQMANGTVKDGRFELTVPMPAEVADNFRPALANFSFNATDGRHAHGTNGNFYVYGIDEEAPADTTPPVIESAYMNHPDFTDGSTVNSSPMLIARITDDVAINLSMAGIGHTMTILLDGKTNLTDVAAYYTPLPDGTPGGTLNYPMGELADGAHTVRLRVWDTDGNSAEKELEFISRADCAPVITRVFTDCNPAITEANFYVTHDQPETMVTVIVTVFNLAGQPVWTGQTTGRCDMFSTAPMTWDLTDSSGRRVPRGIYIYRASVTTNGNTYVSASQRLAVAAE